MFNLWLIPSFYYSHNCFICFYNHNKLKIWIATIFNVHQPRIRRLHRICIWRQILDDIIETRIFYLIKHSRINMIKVMQNDPMRIMKIPITFCISRASSPVPRHPSGGLTAYFLQILLITPDSIIFLMLKHKTQFMRPLYQFLLVIQNWTIFKLLLPSNDKVSIEQIWTIVCYLACLSCLDCKGKLKKNHLWIL